LNYGTKTTLSAAAIIVVIPTAATLVAVGGGAAITPVTAFAYDGGVWGELDGTTIARQQNNQAKKSMDLIVHSKKKNLQILFAFIQTTTRLVHKGKLHLFHTITNYGNLVN
jgi:hypothetical protein